MPRCLVQFTLLLTVALGSLSCGEKPDSSRIQTEKTKNFFEGIPSKISPSSLKNQMAKGQTDFLRSFADDQIPWQLWNKDILKTATDAQLPIMAFVCTPLGQSSRQIARELNSNQTLFETLTKNYVSTVVDARLHPEIAKLCYHLANEINFSTSFPMAIWLSHEGLPLTCIPVGNNSGKDLERVVGSALAMVNDIWSGSSDYAVKNSRRDNESRQERFSFRKPVEGPDGDRNELFRRSTRKLSSLYDIGNNDLDYIGGLLPTSSVELLALGSCSGLLTKEVRERCQTASLDIARQVMTGALRDPLDGSFFYARRTNDWSLPAFSKDLHSQAEVATMFLKTGSILKKQELLNQGLSLLDEIDSRWLKESLMTLSMDEEKESPDTFLWSSRILRGFLNEEEQKLAEVAFSLKEDGNIPSTVDPLGDFYNLNSLRNKLTVPEIARSLNRPENEVSTLLKTVCEKLLKKRMQSTTFASERVMILKDLTAVLKARIDRFNCTHKAEHLTSAIKTADQLVQDFWDSDKGLLRLKKGSEGQLTCGGADYGAVARALTLLYQNTLDPKWLDLATTIFDRGLKDNLAETGLLSEALEAEQVIPLRQHDISMIFGISTLGHTDFVASRLYALTGKEDYRKLIDKHAKILNPRMEDSIVNHTDYSLSCALNDVAYIAVLRAAHTTPESRAFLAVLNSPQYLPFLVIRPQGSAGGLSALEDLPPQDGSPSVLLIRDGKTIGKASSPADLVTLLESTLATSSR